MTLEARDADLLVAGLARVRDDELGPELCTPAAIALFEQIVSTTAAREPGLRGRRGRRVALLAFAAALALALAVSIPALGVGRSIASFFAGWREPDAPVPSAADVVIASGTAGVPWKIVATTSDRGLCLGFVSLHPDYGWIGNAACGPTDVRGDPWAPGAGHWIEAFGNGGGGTEGLTQSFVSGRLAEEVKTVEFRLTDGTAVQAQVVDGPASIGVPVDYYWATWPCRSARCTDGSGPFVRMAVARDAAGRVLERRLPIWNGNPTGDPDGPPPPLG